MFSSKRLQFLLEHYPASTCFWLSYSGGLDSQVLLYALYRILPLSRLRAIHVNHGLHSNALQWANFCEQTCRQWGIDYEIINVNAVAKGGESPEAYARQLRYTALSKRIRAGDYLLTAHHLDDQAETLLLQLLRGSGFRGLASMPFCRPFSEAYLMRPLLKFTRKELFEYAEQKGLAWIEDDTNTDIRFNRNFIRHRVLPLIQQRWPKANKILARSAKNIGEAHHLLENLASKDLESLRGPTSENLNITPLLKLSLERQRNILRYWLKQLNYPMPSQKQLQQLIYLLKSKSGASPKVSWGNVQLRRYRDKLYAFSLEKPTVFRLMRFSWQLEKILSLPELGGYLIAKPVLGEGLAYLSLKDRQVEVAFRQGGERFFMKGRLGSHPLKKLFQEWDVPPWQRQNIPLIYYEEKLISVVGYGTHPDYTAKKNEYGLVIQLIESV